LSPFPQPGFDSSDVSVGGGDDCGGGGGGEDATGAEEVGGCGVVGVDDGGGLGAGGGFGAGGFGDGFDGCGGVVGWECCALCVVGEGAATRVAVSCVGCAF
jgi:hypothetical protein